MRILVCNDDGIDAPGLAMLERAAESLSSDVWCIAPDGKRTAAGSSISIGNQLTMLRVGERRYSCSGTPADCVVAAMTWLFDARTRPDLVLSGINDGRNVAEDLAYSGTLGVAREASFWQLPAIAFSRVKRPQIAQSDMPWIAQLLKKLWQERAGWVLEGHWLSVNLPERLPAPIAQPQIGRDKIARHAEVIEEADGRTVLRIPRGRGHATTSGDENDLIASGHATINRLNWFGETALPSALAHAVSTVCLPV